MGVGDGVYHFGGHEVTVTDGVARLKDGTLASSTVTMNKALQISTEMKLPLGDSIQMAAQTPAELLGYSDIGKIATGFDADLILLNDNFDVVMTMVKGQEIK
jgi:N-acetylglucosamine-6-phosphate deacetylase